MRTAVALLILTACGDEMATPGFDLCGSAAIPADWVILRSAEDVAAIREATELTGLFACEAAGLEAIDLPRLERISSIDVRRCPDLRVVSMPSLRTVGRLRLWELPVLVEIDFGALEEATESIGVSSLSFSQLPGLEAVHLPSLVRSASGLEVFMVAAEVLELPLLAEAPYVSISNTLATALSLPELAGSTGLSVAGNVALREISLPNAQVLAGLDISGSPSLERIELPNVEHIQGGVFMPLGDAPTEVDLSRLVRVDGRLDFVTWTGSDLAWLSSLESVGEYLAIGLGPSVDVTGLDALTSVGGAFSIRQWGGERVDLPNLVSVGGPLAVGVPSMSSFSAPLLTTVGGIDIEETVLSTGAVEFGALRSVSGDVVLRRIDGLRTSALLPVLEHIGGSLTLEEDAATEIRVPELVSVGSLRLISTTATVASLPALMTVADKLLIFENPSLATLDLPALATVGGDFVVANNALFPACEAEALVARLGAAIGGDTATTGNDAGATCEE